MIRVTFVGTKSSLVKEVDAPMEDVLSTLGTVYRASRTLTRDAVLKSAFQKIILEEV